MITIKKSKTADSRSCDFKNVFKETLYLSSVQHIEDVEKGMKFFQSMMNDSIDRHDDDKLSDIDGFYKDFITGFKNTDWYDKHRIINRHHLSADDGVPEDVNLIDVLEMIVDCVMAGLGRTGKVTPIEIKKEVLQKAFDNTVELLKNNVKVVD